MTENYVGAFLSNSPYFSVADMTRAASHLITTVKAEVPNLGYMYPWGNICLSERYIFCTFATN